MKQLYFIEGKLLGESPRENVFWGGNTLAPPSSALIFCARCGEVYAKCPVVRSDGSISSWQSYRRTCARCGRASDLPDAVAGSILIAGDKDFRDALPLAVMLREFQLHLKARGIE